MSGSFQAPGPATSVKPSERWEASAQCVRMLARLAQQIHERTVDANDLIGRMNTEMRSRQMSSVKTVAVRWLLADGLDDEQLAVCGLLDADASRLNPDSLARMRGHFAAQIKTARARYRELPYRELLAQVKGRDYNPPKRERILQWQAEQDFPICPTPDDLSACNVYRELKFPDEVYEDIGDFWEEKVSNES